MGGTWSGLVSWVMTTVECPSRSLTTLTGIPAPMRVVAWVCSKLPVRDADQK